MFKNILSIATMSYLMLAFTNGCTSTEEITRRSQLQHSESGNELEIFTKDNTLYRLETYHLEDSVLSGTGYVLGSNRTERFRGQLPLANMAYLQVRTADVGKTLLAIGAVTAFGAFVASYLESGNPIATAENSQYFNPATGGGGGWGGGGGSCPFIYSWNGASYELEGEAFATGWGKALELKTRVVLPALRESNGELNVRISNERPETHYVNSVQVVAVEADSSAAVYCDGHNSLWPTYHPVGPVRAADQFGGSFATLLQARDGLSWVTDLGHVGMQSGFEEIIEATFLKVESREEATLVIHAINTKIFNTVLKKISEFLGDETLAFVQALEHDPEMIALMKQCLDESSLKASVWNGKVWEPIGSIVAEANERPFTRVIRFSTSKISEDTVRIRLSSLPDVWNLDAVQLDWTPVQPLKARSVQMISARHTNGKKDVVHKLTQADNAYAVIFPPDRIDFRFHPLQPASGKKIVYAIDVQGYLHEWFPASSKGPTVLPASMTFGTKISLLKTLLRERTILLSVIYDEWRKGGRK